MAELDPVTVACCQIAPSVEHPDGNLELTRHAVREALAAGAQLVVLPELASSGYVFESAREARAAAERSEDVLAAWSAEAARAAQTRTQTQAQVRARAEVLIVGGFPELAPDGRVYNSCALVDGSGVRAVYRKVHLWDREADWFEPGDAEPPVIDTALGRIGLAVCYDLEFPELTRGLALAGADLITVPTNWPRSTVSRDTPILTLLACATAYLSKVVVAVCDRCGSERGLAFEGGSVIAGPDGRVLAGGEPSAAASSAPLTLSAECSLQQARDKRSGERNDAFADRRPELYGPPLRASTD